MNKFMESLPGYEDVFSFKNLYESAMKCRRGVAWKKEVQKYHADLSYNISILQRNLISGKYRSKGFTEFDVIERGKKRHIRAPAYQDRIVQRCLCDNYLVPLLSHFIIYDNSATIKNRGTEFAIKRLKCHLEKFSRNRSGIGYILLYDFKDYFNSISHDVLYRQIDPLFTDVKLKSITHHFIDAFGDRGLGLGSQVSQICAVYFPNRIDHYFKDQCGMKYYGRYMDDGYIISDDLEAIKRCRADLFRLADDLDLQINDQKVRIIKLSHSFTWLKHKFKLDDNGSVCIRLLNKSFMKMRGKLRKLDGKIPYSDIEDAYKSWRGNAVKYSNYFKIKELDDFFNEMYINNFIHGG